MATLASKGSGPLDALASCTAPNGVEPTLQGKEQSLLACMQLALLQCSCTSQSMHADPDEPLPQDLMANNGVYLNRHKQAAQYL